MSAKRVLTHKLSASVTSKPSGSPYSTTATTKATTCEITNEVVEQLLRDFYLYAQQLVCPCCYQPGTIVQDGFVGRTKNPRVPKFKCDNCMVAQSFLTTKAALEHMQNSAKPAEPKEDAILPKVTPSKIPVPRQSKSPAPAPSPDTVHTTVEVVPQPDQLASAPNVEYIHPSTPDWVLTFQAQFRQYDQRLQQVESLVAENQQLREALSKVQEERDSLKIQLALSQQLEIDRGDTIMEDSPLTATDQPVVDLLRQGTAASKFAHTIPTAPPGFLEAAKKGAKATPQKNTSRPRKPQSLSPKKQAALARNFFPPSATQGFQYIYLTNRTKVSSKVLRAQLHGLGLPKGRILDIHYPDRFVVAILVHNDFASTAIEILAKNTIRPLAEFDPTDPARIRDPKFDHLTVEERQQKALDLHQNRLLLGISRIREPVRLAVIRHFTSQNWVTKAQVDTFLADLNQPSPNTTPTTTTNQDTEMGETSSSPAQIIKQTQIAPSDIVLPDAGESVDEQL